MTPPPPLTQVMHCVSGHPNIVTLHDVFEDRDFVHIVVDLCQV